ncbi:MAG: carbon-nitrogen hydrolase family protein [Burkholderiaceae bacterium]
MSTEQSFPSFKVAGIQMVSSPDLKENLDQAAILIAEAAQSGAKLVSLPEYFCFMGLRDRDKWAIKEDAVQGGPIQAFLADQARTHKIWLAGGTIPLAVGGEDRVFNSSLVYGPDGTLAARYDKIHLFKFASGKESYDESTAIRPGTDPAHFSVEGAGIGLSVCYDLRFPELYRALNQPALILVPAAFTYTTGKAHWELLLRARAIENQCYVLAPAQGGHHANGRQTWGHTMLIDPWGDVVDVLAEGPGVVGGTIDASRLNAVRTSLPALQHRVM